MAFLPLPGGILFSSCENTVTVCVYLCVRIYLFIWPHALVKYEYSGRNEEWVQVLEIYVNC
jgi:hypothetical protein